jgi:hypothetical protein
MELLIHGHSQDRHGIRAAPVKAMVVEKIPGPVHIGAQALVGAVNHHFFQFLHELLHEWQRRGLVVRSQKLVNRFDQAKGPVVEQVAKGQTPQIVENDKNGDTATAHGARGLGGGDRITGYDETKLGQKETLPVVVPGHARGGKHIRAIQLIDRAEQVVSPEWVTFTVLTATTKQESRASAADIIVVGIVVVLSVGHQWQVTGTLFQFDRDGDNDITSRVRHRIVRAQRADIPELAGPIKGLEWMSRYPKRLLVDTKRALCRSLSLGRKVRMAATSS